MPSTPVTTHSITSLCTCCWGNLSTLKCASSAPQIPVWCCWCTSVWPTPALEKQRGCCFTMGMLEHLHYKNNQHWLNPTSSEQVVSLKYLKYSCHLSRCPNPLDPAPPETVLSDPTPPSPQSQTRRFTISTFQFLPDGEFQDMDEEVRLSRDDHCKYNPQYGLWTVALTEFIYILPVCDYLLVRLKFKWGFLFCNTSFTHSWSSFGSLSDILHVFNWDMLSSRWSLCWRMLWSLTMEKWI